VQLESGKFQGKVFQAISPTYNLSHAQFNRPLKQRGLPPRKLRNIVIPGTSSLQIKWRSHQVNGNSIMIFPLGGELESISNRNFDVFIVGIAEEQLARMSKILDLPPLNSLIKEAEVVDCCPLTVAQLRYKLYQLTHELVTNPELLNHVGFSNEVEVEFLQQLLLALNGGKSISPISTPRRKEYTLKCAEEYINQYVYKGLTIREICEDLNISERTLRSAFCDHYGISPKTYLKRYQLTQIHRQLRQAEPSSVTVSAIANNWGFWHMGQFAKDYTAMFGELPSVTLQRQ
jgi:AraC family ethanolamine operon transcriptional activator